MHTRGGSSTRGQSGFGFASQVSSPLQAMLATMATIYVAGRQQKKVSAVDMELAAARQAGFVSKKLIGRKTNRDAIRKAWMPTETSEIYSISSALVQFISVNRSIFHTRAHDDVCTGSWLGFIRLCLTEEQEKGHVTYKCQGARCMNFQAMHLVGVDPDCTKTFKKFMRILYTASCHSAH
uniref:Uncharacterized protein n=1 Tax=Salix viminalis TaxID=40686 RepID=A0A6N2M4L7_SALVM